MKFVYIDNVQQLTAIRNQIKMVVYVDGSNKMLFEKVLAVIA